MGGGGTETQTQTNGAANPQVDKTVTQLLTGLQGQVKSGTAVFDKSLYPGMSSTTTGGVNSVVNAANAGQGGLNSAYDWTQGLLNNGGLTSGQKQDIAGTNTIGTQYGRMAADATNPSLTESALMKVARGGSFGTNDPGYATLRKGALNDALTGVGSSFLTDGRFGSSVMGDAAGTAATETLAGLDYANFQNDQQRQLQALSAIEGARQQGVNNRSNALAGQLGATGAGFGMEQQGTVNAAGAASAIPGLYGATLLPGQTQIAAGQVLDADALAKRQAENDLFRRKNDAGWSTLGQASSILAGTAGSGTQQQSLTTPTAPWWQEVLGAGAIGSGIYKNVWGS